MFFVKFHPLFIACIGIFSLNACVPQVAQSDFDRYEAGKARITLALAYLEQNDFSKARENIDRALAHSPQDYLPHSVLAYYYQQLNQFESAEKSYQTALELSRSLNEMNQPLPDILNNYATFLCHQRQFEKADRLFEQALKSDSPYYHQTETLENIAQCAFQANNMPRFQQTLSRLSVLSPDKADRIREEIK